MGSDDELVNRRARLVRGAGMGLSPRCPWYARHRQVGGREADASGADRIEDGIRERTNSTRRQRGAERRIRDRLWDSQSHLDLQVHRHDAAGSGLPRQTGPAGRRRRTRASPGRWTWPQHRGAGCSKSGMEAGPGGQADIAREPPRYLSHRAAPGRCPRTAQHDGAHGAAPFG